MFSKSDGFLPASSRRSSATFAGAKIIGTLPVMPLDTPSTAVCRKIINSLMIFLWYGCWTNTISIIAGIMSRRCLVLFNILSSHRWYEYTLNICTKYVQKRVLYYIFMYDHYSTTHSRYVSFNCTVLVLHLLRHVSCLA